MWVARSCVSTVMNGRCAVWIALARVVAAELPTRSCPGWVFMRTMTCWLTFTDSAAAKAGVIGPNSADGATLAGVTGTAAACPAISAVAPAAAATMNRLLPHLFSLRPDLGACIYSPHPRLRGHLRPLARQVPGRRVAGSVSRV